MVAALLAEATNPIPLLQDTLDLAHQGHQLLVKVGDPDQAIQNHGSGKQKDQNHHHLAATAHLQLLPQASWPVGFHIAHSSSRIQS